MSLGSDTHVYGRVCPSRTFLSLVYGPSTVGVAPLHRRCVNDAPWRN